MCCSNLLDMSVYELKSYDLMYFQLVKKMKRNSLAFHLSVLWMMKGEQHCEMDPMNCVFINAMNAGV